MNSVPRCIWGDRGFRSVSCRLQANSINDLCVLEFDFEPAGTLSRSITCLPATNIGNMSTTRSTMFLPSFYRERWDFSVGMAPRLDCPVAAVNIAEVPGWSLNCQSPSAL